MLASFISQTPPDRGKVGYAKLSEGPAARRGTELLVLPGRLRGVGWGGRKDNTAEKWEDGCWTVKPGQVLRPPQWPAFYFSVCVTNLFCIKLGGVPHISCDIQSIVKVTPDNQCSEITSPRSAGK